MKRTATALIAATLILLTACKKEDHCDKPKQTSCDLMQVLESSSSKDGSSTVSRYRKEYDPATSRVRKVVVGLFQFELVDSVTLIPSYSGNNIYFLSDGHPGDTVITATFDASNRLMKLTAGNAPNDRLVPMVFSYSSGKLSKLHFNFGGFSGDLVPSYDANGNITQLKDPTGLDQSYFYTYDLAVSATQQFYSDDFFGDDYNSLYFAEFMGWLPDLLPVNKRVTSRVVTGDYEISNASLINHVYDVNEKLISYQSGATFTNIWNCDGKTDGHKKCHDH